MKILAIDSSGLVASVALVEDSVMIAEYTVNYKKTHSQTLLPMLDEIKRMTELDLNEIDALAVTKGPGSFTGLRIGSATVKGLGFALNKPVISVPTVDTLAMNAWGYDGLVCPIMDARRQQVYTGIYSWDEALESVGAFGKLHIIMEQRPMAIEALIDKINELDCDKSILFLGDGVPVYEEIIKERLKKQFEFVPAHINRQRAGALGVLAEIYFKRGIIETAKEHKPEYLRLSQAERERAEAKKTLVNSVSSEFYAHECAEEETSSHAFGAGKRFDQRFPNNIIIRPMTEEDADEVAKIEEETFSMPWRKKDFLEMIERDNMTYLVILLNEKIIGGAGIREIVGDIEITNVVISEDYRKRGYGKMLLDAVLEEGKRLGGTQFTLEVRRSNQAAIRLYEKAGFESEGVRKDFYEKPKEDALIMWKRPEG